MIVRVVRWVFAIAVGLNTAMAVADGPGSSRTQETPLSNLIHEVDRLPISPESGDGLVQFSLAPSVNAHEGRLFLGLTAIGDDAPALIVVVNNSRAVRIEPSDVPITAEIDLPGHVLRTGTNIVSLALEHDQGGSWQLDGTHSRLRVRFDDDYVLESLGEVEAALASDVPAINSVFIADRPNDIMLEAVIAQGVAMRMGRAPQFVASPEFADLRVFYDLDPSLAGPEIRFGGDDGRDLTIAGRHQQDMESGARLFASRSIRQADQVFRVADALSAAAIGTEHTRIQPEGATLREFSQARLPFGDGRGSQTAVVVTEADGDGRLAALSIMARTSIAHGTAWIYSWYGSDSQRAPENRHLVFIGTGVLSDRSLVNAAPVEFRTALRAAAEQPGQRSGLRLSSAAYAEDEWALSGVATVYTDPQNPTRWIAGFTSPQPTGFNRASEILSRSGHWSALAGRAALWDADGVTSYDYSVDGPPTLAARFGLPEFSMRELAAILFILTLLFILRGVWRGRRVHDKSRGWK
jgi:hypothetical protein